MRVARRRNALIAVTGVLALLLAACGSSNAADDVTVTSFVTSGPDSSASTSEPAASSSGAASSSEAPASPATSSAPTQSAGGAVQEGVAMPSGFVPKKLQPGEKPPQFIIVSFDGVG